MKSMHLDMETNELIKAGKKTFTTNILSWQSADNLSYDHCLRDIKIACLVEWKTLTEGWRELNVLCESLEVVLKIFGFMIQSF